MRIRFSIVKSIYEGYILSIGVVTIKQTVQEFQIFEWYLSISSTILKNSCSNNVYIMLSLLIIVKVII